MGITTEIFRFSGPLNHLTVFCYFVAVAKVRFSYKMVTISTISAPYIAGICYFAAASLFYSTVLDAFSQNHSFTIFHKSSSSLETSMGFAIWPFIPASNAAFLSSSKALAVMAIIGIPATSGFSNARICLVAS